MALSFSLIPKNYRLNQGKASSGLSSRREESDLSALGAWKSERTSKSQSGSLSGLTSVLGFDLNSSVLSHLVRDDTSKVSAVDKKVSSSLTKEFVSALEAQAKEDAKAGVYGKDGKAEALRAEQMKQYISPDRDSAIAQVTKLLANGSTMEKVSLRGLPYTASISGTTAEIYDASGETIARCDRKSGKWESVATKAESQFRTASSSIYDEAYRAEEYRASHAGGGLSLNIRT